MNARTTVAVACTVLWGAASVLLASGLWAVVGSVSERPDAAPRIALVIGGAAGLAFTMLAAMVWIFLHRRLVAPLAALTRESEILSWLDSEGAIDMPEPHALGALVATVEELGGKLRAARGEMSETVAAATARVEEAKGRLEAILLDLSEGVVVCSLDHHVMLYNQAAARILRAPEVLGLGRPLFEVVTREPVIHTLERLVHRLGESRLRADELTEPFVCATEDSRVLLQARMSLVRDAGGADTAATGYVLTFADVSREIEALARRDSLLRAATEGLRAPLANLRAAAETLAAHADMDAGERDRFERVIHAEATALSERLETIAEACRGLPGGQWPMADVYSVDLINCVIRHLEPGETPKVTMVGAPIWLHGDSHALMLTIMFLIRRVRAETGIDTCDIEARPGDHRVYLDIVWRGSPIPSQTLDEWCEVTLERTLGGVTLHDVLERHGSTLWSQLQRPGHALLRMPLGAALRPRPDEDREPLPPRPEFYDFDLVRQPSGMGPLGDRLLRDLSYVAFDTETTGLRPSRGDEIVSVAGVRIVNGRILTGETFYRIVDPERPIPALSTRFHGITDDMVADKPPARVVLPQFRRFAGDAVLIAFNAAFDMAFLERREEECGIRFDNTVIDVLLLSAYLHDHDPDHSLDAVAARFGVKVSARHTALGDAMATAGIFLRMLDLLEGRNIRTLREALDAADAMVELRKQQARF